MDSKRGKITACQALGLPSPDTPSSASPPHSSKLKFLRRYVTDTASHALADESSARGRRQRGKGGEHARRRTRQVESFVGAAGDIQDKERGSRNVYRLRLRHDALGEAETPPPRLGAGGSGVGGLPGSNNRQAAARFDALQFGRVLHLQAGANVQAYSLAAEGRWPQRQHPAPDSETDEGTGKDEKFSERTDSDEEGIVVVDDMGRTIRFDDVQQREIKVLLKAEEYQVQHSMHDTGQGLAHASIPALDTDTRKRLIPDGAGSPPATTEKASTLVRKLSSSQPKITTAGGECASMTEFLGEVHGCERALNDISRKLGCREAGEMWDAECGGRRRPQGYGTQVAEDTDLSPPRRRRGSAPTAARAVDSHSQAAARSSTSTAKGGNRVASSLDDDSDYGSGRLCRKDEDSDLSPPRRGPDKRSTHSRGEARTHSDAGCCSSGKVTDGASGALLSSGDRDSNIGEAAKAVLPSSRVGRSPATPGSRPPEVLLSETSASTRVQGGRSVATPSTFPTPYRRGAHAVSIGTPVDVAASGEVKRFGDQGTISQRIVYRDKQGRVVTEEEWLELKDPVARRQKYRKKERLPPAELAWGGGLVQQAERAQTAAEEAILEQQPMARYDLDEDVDLALQRKERWGDPLAEVPARRVMPQADATPFSTVQVDAQPEDRTIKTFTTTADRPKCPFDAPKNRFGIEPGYRWDGVVRGNGYEDRRLKALTKRKLEERQKYLDNVADM